MKVIIEQEIDETWVRPEEAATMTDEALIDLFREDLLQLIHGATWTIVRDTPKEPAK